MNGDKAETVLLPSTHTVVIKYLTSSDSSFDKTADKDAANDFKVSVTAADGKQLSVGEASANTKRTLNIYDAICMPNYSSVHFRQMASL